MKLKKMVLHNEHEVMGTKEMKLILGGIYTKPKDTCQKNAGICSGTCYDREDKDVLTGKITITKMSCQAVVGADPTKFLCNCDIDVSIP